MRNAMVGVGLLFGLLVASNANAVTLGDTVTCTNPVGTNLKCSAASAIVGSGSEFYLYNTLPRVGNFTDFTFDFSTNFLTITSGPSYSIGSTSPVYFNITDATNPFTNVALISATGHLDDGTPLNPTIDQSNFSVVNGVLKFNLASAQYSNAVIKLDLSPASIATPAPEPSTWGMMVLGFGVMGGALRRRRDVCMRVCYSA